MYKNERLGGGGARVRDETRWCDNVAALRHTTTMPRSRRLRCRNGRTDFLRFNLSPIRTTTTITTTTVTTTTASVIRCRRHHHHHHRCVTLLIRTANAKAAHPTRERSRSVCAGRTTAITKVGLMFRVKNAFRKTNLSMMKSPRLSAGSRETRVISTMRKAHNGLVCSKVYSDGTMLEMSPRYSVMRYKVVPIRFRTGEKRVRRRGDMFSKNSRACRKKNTRMIYQTDR